MNLTNKVRLCERSEPQSEPFVGRARFDHMWTVVVGFWKITLDIGRRLGYLENIFFEMGFEENQWVGRIAFSYDFHD